MAPRVEPLYVLYGSQMGNSEQAAKDFCALLTEQYTAEFFESQGLEPIQVETTCIQLDDFLELHHAAFTKCLVVFVSSYGVGQAPLGAYRYREVCEAWKESTDDKGTKATLEGLQYALCGLGDSSYPTYLQNPTTIDQGMTAAGATRIGEMGKADANAVGDNAQDKVIAQWTQGIWVPLAKALCDTVHDVDTSAMQSKTIPLLVKLDPDYTPPKELQGQQGGGSSMMGLLGVSLVGVAVAVAVAAATMKSS